MAYLSFSSKKIEPKTSLEVFWTNIPKEYSLQLKSNVELDITNYTLNPNDGSIKIAVPEQCNYITFNLYDNTSCIESQTLVQDFDIHLWHNGAFRQGKQFVYRDGQWI